MESIISVKERVNFSDRLLVALRAAGVSSKTSEFVKAFNIRADGAAVSPHAARKWLHGEAIPTQEKIVILADWLCVHAAWLRYGEAENGIFEKVLAETGIPPAHLSLIRDVMSLPLPAQETIRDVVNSLCRAYSSEGSKAKR